jgi:uncharacterized protein YjdB
VATVSQSGAVSASAVGSTTITVTTADGNKTDTCTVTVSADPIAVSGVSLNKMSTTIALGGFETLTAAVTPPNASNKEVNWTSSDTSVETVTGGIILSVKAGKTTITARTVDGGKTATCEVSVSATSEPVTAVTLNKASTTILASGKETLVPVFTPANATNQNVTWRSGNTAVASVTESGLVRGVSAGTTTIKVVTADGNKTDTCTVTVTTALTISVVILGNPQISDGVGLTADVQKNFPGEVSYQWYRGATAIENETYYKFYPRPEDGDKAIKVKATCDGKSAESAPVNVPNTAFTVVFNKWDDQLYAYLSIGMYNYSISESFTCQWYRDNVAIPGATQSNYTLTSADAGKAIKIKVTGNGQTVESDPYNVPAPIVVEFVNASSRLDEEVEDIMKEVWEAYENNLNDCKTAIDDIGRPCYINFSYDLEWAKVINGKLQIAFSLAYYDTLPTDDLSERLFAIGTKLKDLADNTVFVSKSGNTGNFEDTHMAKLRLPSNAVATAAVISAQI